MTNKDYDISDLIPDYCNDRLDAKEKADFERLLEEDQELRDEYNDFLSFQELYREIDPVEPSPSEAIFDQISSNISAEQKVERKAPVQSNALVEAVKDYWQQLREFMTVPWMLTAAQAVVIVLLLMPATKQDTTPQNTYTTLSSGETSVSAETISINVVFQPKTFESDIRSLLHSIEGSVSSGPSREGRYVVTISDQGELEQAVQTLKQSDIVLFAEPVK